MEYIPQSYNPVGILYNNIYDCFINNILVGYERYPLLNIFISSTLLYINSYLNQSNKEIHNLLLKRADLIPTDEPVDLITDFLAKTSEDYILKQQDPNLYIISQYLLSNRLILDDSNLILLNICRRYLLTIDNDYSKHWIQPEPVKE